MDSYLLNAGRTKNRQTECYLLVAFTTYRKCTLSDTGKQLFKNILNGHKEYFDRSWHRAAGNKSGTWAFGELSLLQKTEMPTVNCKPVVDGHIMSSITNDKRRREEKGIRQETRNTNRRYISRIWWKPLKVMEEFETSWCSHLGRISIARRCIESATGQGTQCTVSYSNHDKSTSIWKFRNYRNVGNQSNWSYKLEWPFHVCSCRKKFAQVDIKWTIGS